jgi:hypothetical protein
MAKVKFIDLKDKNLEFVRNDMRCVVQSLKKQDMTVDIVCYKDDKFIKNDTIAFAQLTKEIKKVINKK